MSMENSSDTTVNRTSDLMVFRAVPQPTAQPRAPITSVIFYILASYEVWCKNSLRKCTVVTKHVGEIQGKWIYFYVRFVGAFSRFSKNKICRVSRITVRIMAMVNMGSRQHKSSVKLRRASCITQKRRKDSRSTFRQDNYWSQPTSSACNNK